MKGIPRDSKEFKGVEGTSREYNGINRDLKKFKGIQGN